MRLQHWPCSSKSRSGARQAAVGRQKKPRDRLVTRSAPKVADPTSNACYSELISWLKEKGAQGVDNVNCVEFAPGERGLVAVRPIERGGDVFEVPLALAIFDWPGAQVDSPGLQDAPSNVRLAVKLLRVMAASGCLPPDRPEVASACAPATGVVVRRTGEQDNAACTSAKVAPPPPPPAPTAPAAPTAAATGTSPSMWIPYLRTLPQNPPAMLITFTSAEDLAWLEYPPLEQALLSYRSLVSYHYHRCGGPAGEALGGATLEQFTWALAVVSSRCLAVNMLLLALMAPQDPPTASPRASLTTRQQPGPTAPTARAATATSTLQPPVSTAAAGDQSCGACGSTEGIVGSREAATTNSSFSSSSPSMLLMLMSLAGSSLAPSSSTVPNGTASTVTPTSNASQNQHAPVGTTVVDMGLCGRPAAGGELRLLVPLLDMMNHRMERRVGGRFGGGGGGDSQREHLVSEVNVRWELRPPREGSRTTAGNSSSSAEGDFIPSTKNHQERNCGSSSSSGGASVDGSSDGWRVVVVATADIATGQELCLCYDANACNDTFALHYGFLPPFSPRDDVQLYDSLSEALRWCRTEELDLPYLPAAAVTSAEVAEVSVSGAVAAVDAAAREAAAAAAGTVSMVEGEGAAPDGPVKLGPHGHVCPRLMAALRYLLSYDNSSNDLNNPNNDHDDHPNPPSTGGATPDATLTKTATVAAVGAGKAGAAAEAAQAAAQALVVRRCMQLLRSRTPLLRDLSLLLADYDACASRLIPAAAPAAAVSPAAPAGATATTLTAAPADASHAAPAAAASHAAPTAVPLVLPSEAATWAVLRGHYLEALASQPEGVRRLAGCCGSDVGGMAAHHDSSGRGSSSWDGSSSGKEGGGRGGGSVAEAEVGGELPGGVTLPLTPQQRLALKYRLYKKMLLWDCVLGVAGRRGCV